MPVVTTTPYKIIPPLVGYVYKENTTNDIRIAWFSTKSGSFGILQKVDTLFNGGTDFFFAGGVTYIPSNDEIALIAQFSGSKRLRTYDRLTGNLVASQDAPAGDFEASFNSIAFDLNDGSRFWSAYFNGFGTANEFFTLPYPHGSSPAHTFKFNNPTSGGTRGIAFDPDDGNLWATIDVTNKVARINSTTGALIGSEFTDAGTNTTTIVVKDGNLIIAAADLLSNTTFRQYSKTGTLLNTSPNLYNQVNASEGNGMSALVGLINWPFDGDLP